MTPQRPQPAPVAVRDAQRAPERQPERQPERPMRNWDRQVKAEETYDDVKRENDRLEKEIWLEIAEIRNIKLD
jgi:hypothetical protein